MSAIQPPVLPQTHRLHKDLLSVVHDPVHVLLHLDEVDLEVDQGEGLRVKIDQMRYASGLPIAPSTGGLARCPSHWDDLAVNRGLLGQGVCRKLVMDGNDRDLAWKSEGVEMWTEGY